MIDKLDNTFKCVCTIAIVCVTVNLFIDLDWKRTHSRRSQGKKRGGTLRLRLSIFDTTMLKGFAAITTIRFQGRRLEGSL